MALNFPNPSRSFDAARNGVRFTGHDGLFEVSFLVEAAALAKSESGRPDDPGMDTLDADERRETGALSAFDRQRRSVQDVAREAYSNDRHASYVLVSSDFR